MHGDPEIVHQGREGAPKYLLNHRFFSDVSDEEHAYWLGFFTADGAVVNTSVRLELAEKDTCHLESFKMALESTHPIRAHGTTRVVSIGSWRMVKDLNALGVTQNKSKTVEPWDGPVKLMRHYWRGLVDGDGSIYRTRTDWTVNLVGSRFVVNAFATWVKSVCATRAQPHLIGGTSAWGFAVQGPRLAQRVVAELYGDAQIALPRKAALAAELTAIDLDSLRLKANLARSAGMRAAWDSGRFVHRKR